MLLDLKVLLTLAMIIKQTLTCQILLSLQITSAEKHLFSTSIWPYYPMGAFGTFELEILEILFQHLQRLRPGFLDYYFLNHGKPVSAMDPRNVSLATFLWLFFQLR